MRLLRFGFSLRPESVRKLAPSLVLALVAAGASTSESLATESPVVAGEPHMLPLAQGGERALSPRLTRGAGGAIVLSWQEQHGDSAELRYAHWTGRAWSAPETVSRGRNWFLNWADTPAVLPLANGLLAHALVKSSAGTYSYDVQLFGRRPDSGWQALGTAHDDGTASEHGFVSALPRGNGALMVWLDGRETASAGHDPASHGGSDHAGGGGGAMTLRSAEVSVDGRIGMAQQIDARVCDCCATDLVASGEDALAIYRDRSERNVRDISVARYRGGRWQTLHTFADGWQIDGCPVNGPRLAARGDKVVAVWYSAAGNVPKVRAAFSIDGGEHFSAPQTVVEGNTLGRVAVAMLGDGSAVIGHFRQDGAQAHWQLLMRAPSGKEFAAKKSVFSVPASRASGVPQLLLTDRDQLLMAWTEVNGKETRIRSARLDLSPRGE